MLLTVPSFHSSADFVHDVAFKPVGPGTKMEDVLADGNKMTVFAAHQPVSYGRQRVNACLEILSGNIFLNIALHICHNSPARGYMLRIKFSCAYKSLSAGFAQSKKFSTGFFRKGHKRFDGTSPV